MKRSDSSIHSSSFHKSFRLFAGPSIFIFIYMHTYIPLFLEPLFPSVFRFSLASHQFSVVSVRWLWFHLLLIIINESGSNYSLVIMIDIEDATLQYTIIFCYSFIIHSFNLHKSHFILLKATVRDLLRRSTVRDM